MAILSEGRRLGATWNRPDAWPAISIAIVSTASVLIIALLAVVIWLSFREGGLGDPDAAYSLANYPEMFANPFTWRVLANTLAFALATLVVALAIGMPSAWLVERTDLPGKSVFFTLMSVGLLIPGFASAMGWLFLMHPQIGLVNRWAKEGLGLEDPLFDISTVVGMGWVQGLSLAPIAFIMTAAVFRAMDPTLEEAAQMCGASLRQTIRRIAMPLAWPGVLAAAIFIFTIGFAAFDVPAIIGWCSRKFTVATYLVLQLNPEGSLPRYGLVAALSSLLIAFALLLSWWYARMQREAHRYRVVGGKAYRPRIVQLGRGKPLAWFLAGLYFTLSKLLPVVVLAWASVLPYFQLPSEAAFRSMSLARYDRLPWHLITDGIANTAMLMVLTPTVTLALSLMFSWVVLRSKLRFRAGFDVVAFLPHAVPSIVFGVGALMLALFVIERIVPILGTIWSMLLVFVVGRLSYGSRMTNSGLIQIHRELEETGQMSGAGTFGVVWRVLLPLLTPTLLYAWLWIALLTFRELTLAVVLTTRDNITLPFIIWNMWTSGAFGNAAALSFVMLFLMLPLVALYWYVARKRGITVA
jgi:iron(III) transport system permease protein